MVEQYPVDLTLEQVLVEHRKANQNPNITYVSHAILKEGLRSAKVATIFQIINPRTDELHHYSLKLETLTRRKETGWQVAENRSITLDTLDEGSGEIGKLIGLIASVTQGLLPDEDGSYIVVDSRNQTARELLNLVQGLDASDKQELSLKLLSELSTGTSDFQELEMILDREDGSLLRGIAVASALVQYRRAYDHLKRLLEHPSAKEQSFQDHLEENPWIFGSEYSELLDRRTWTRDDKQDFMLRRTVDGYLEVVEIKLPSHQLFRNDSSHDSYYPSAQLSQTIGQVMRYIEGLERNRDSIIAQDGQDPLKVRARIIIGRDKGTGQQVALRNLNAHLNRIEILTYDQLLRIAEHVLEVFQNQQQGMSDDIDDLPF